MALLAIETATRQLGVAVVEGEQVLSAYELLADYPHAVELPGAVTSVLKEAGTTLEQIEAIAVDIGPGSFTGLRIGLAFAKALAFPAKKPLVGVASLDVLAANVPFSPRLVCPVLDARQKNVYAALYRLQDEQVVRQSDYLLGSADEILGLVKEPAIFLGDGITRYRELILKRCPEPLFAQPELWLPRVATLGRLAAARVRRGETDAPERLVPLYLYPLDCSVRGPDRPTSVLPQTVVRSP
jgi:tRNA threonylcarbamoyladenosine biosynthesis protein TsaB